MNARLQVWAKGFPLRGRSPEFDLVVPSDRGHLKGIEQRLSAFSMWGKLIESLYKLGDTSMQRQFVALFDATEVSVVTAAPSADHLRRSSIVLVAASLTGIDWRDQRLADRIARVHGLSERIAKAYGKSLAGAPALVLDQLRENNFLPDREFDIEHEEPPERLDWQAIVHEVKRWKGITGVGTAPLAQLGANVLYGTRDEVDRVGSDGVAAVFEVARGRIEPIDQTLELWAKEQPQPETVDSSKAPEADMDAERRSVEEIWLNSKKALEVLTEIRDLIKEALQHRKGDDRKKGRW